MNRCPITYEPLEEGVPFAGAETGRRPSDTGLAMAPPGRGHLPAPLRLGSGEAGRLGGLRVLDDGDLLVEIGLHALLYMLDIGGTSGQDPLDVLVHQRDVEHVLGREVFVAAALGFVVGRVENGLYFLAHLHGALL